MSECHALRVICTDGVTERSFRFGAEAARAAGGRSWERRLPAGKMPALPGSPSIKRSVTPSGNLHVSGDSDGSISFCDFGARCMRHTTVEPERTAALGFHLSGGRRWNK